MTCQDAGYPERLLQLHDFPLVLYVKGKLPRFALCRQDLPLRRDGEDMLARLLRALPGAEQVGAGLRLRQGEGWVTLSLQTRPAALRVVGEARTAELARGLCDFCVRRAEEAGQAGPEK